MGSQTHREAIMSERVSQTSEGEPIVERERKVQLRNESSVMANLTKEGRDIVGIEPGTTVTIQVFNDHLRVFPEE